MARQSSTRGYKGRGRFTVRRRAGGRPFELGNCVSLTENFETARDGRQDFQDVAGGELDVDERIESFTFEAQVDDITPMNQALAQLGSLESIASASVSDELQDAWADHRVAFRYLPDPDESITVEIHSSTTHDTETEFEVGETITQGGRVYLCVVGGETGAVAPSFPDDFSTVSDGEVTWKDLGEPALAADTEYTRTPHGIRVLEAAAQRFHEELPIPLEVGYTRNPQYLIQALVASGDEYEIIWHGLNAIDGGNPITRRYFRVRFSPTSGFVSHGGEDFASLTLTGTVLADETRTGPGESRFAETAMI